MSDLKMHTANLVAKNIEKLTALFPNCITETRNEQGEIVKGVDFDLLRQELSEVLVEGKQERYTLNWVGKKESILAANAPIAKTLRPCREERDVYKRQDHYHRYNHFSINTYKFFSLPDQ